MYLYHILNRPKDELIKRMYEAQKSNPSKSDWVKTVVDKLRELKIDFCDGKIANIYKKNS